MRIRLFGIVSVAVALLLSSASVYADVVGNNRFFRLRQEEIKLLERNLFAVHNPDGSVTIKTEPRPDASDPENSEIPAFHPAKPPWKWVPDPSWNDWDGSCFGDRATPVKRPSDAPWLPLYVWVIVGVLAVGSVAGTAALLLMRWKRARR